MKILHVLSQKPEATGSGIYITALIRNAAEKGHENHLLAGVQRGYKPDTDLLGTGRFTFVEFEGVDLPFKVTGMSDIMPYPSSRFRDLGREELEIYKTRFREKIREAVAEFKPDIIHSHHLWIVTALCRDEFPDIPVVSTCHGSDLRQFRSCDHLRRQVREGCRKLDLVMALNIPQKEEIAGLYGIEMEKITVTGAGFSISLFSPGEKPVPPPVRIVYAGKLSSAKGVPWMLRALKNLRETQWELDIIGSGSGREMREIVRMAEGLGSRAQLRGLLPQVELAGIMKTSHLFVLPSLYEGLPLVILEALACGCRVVATKLPGVMELLGGHQAGFISLVELPRLVSVDVPVKEDEEWFTANLAEALRVQVRRAEKDPEIELALLPGVINRYRWESIFDRVEEVYAGVIDGFRRGRYQA